MALHRPLLLTLLLAVTFSSGFGQQDSLAQAEEYYKMGMEIFDYSHRKQAAELFLLSTQANPKSAKAQFMTGRSIMLTIRKEQSLSYFKKAYQLDPKVDADILYYLGLAYHYSEKFDSAILLYDRYNRLLARSLDYDKSKKINEVNRKIFECQNAKVMITQPVDVSIAHLNENINSEYPDYAPTIDASETFMVFTTRRPEENLNAKVAQDHEYYEDIFYSKKVNGEWTPARNIAGPLNNNYHNASVNLSPDGKEMLLYHDSNGGDIFATFLRPDGTWTDPADLEGVNTQYIENSASITNDGKKLYFTSNRPGGYGGTDIYVSTKDSRGRWINPQNLGSLINTELDEDGVFISANGKHLYFSSNGHAGMGDMDIYKSVFNEATQQWDKPVNMGYPINSVENDIYFVLTGDEQFAYISSLRPENIGEQDIYKIDIRNWKTPLFARPEFVDAVQELEEAEPLFAAAKVVKEEPKAPLVPVAVESVTTGTPQLPATIVFSVYVAEGSSRKPLSAKVSLTAAHSTEILFKEDKAGTYSTEMKNAASASTKYKLHVSSNEYIPYSSSYYFGANQKEALLTDTIYLDKIAVNYNRVISVYFGHASDVPKSFEDIRYLEQIMKTSSTMKVEISGHTDNIGSPEYNVLLSRRRAEAVKKHLVESGIETSRITVAGYGSARPISENKTRQGRSLNRRTEFTITEK